MQTFDYEQVKIKMDALNEVFNNFSAKLDAMDIALNNNVAAGEDSALQGVVATALLTSWNSYSATFDSFKNEFTNLYNSVQQVSQNNAKLDEETMSSFGSSGFTSAGGTTVGGANNPTAAYYKM